MSNLKNIHILLIDHDDAFRHAVMRMIEGAGLSAAPARHFSDAASIIESNERIDLLITDVGMPARNPRGASIVLIAREKHPDLKVIYMSGIYDADQIDAIWENARFLAKPFVQEDLIRTIREVLAIPLAADSVRFASLDETIAALHNEPEPMVLTRFTPNAADRVIIAKNNAASIVPYIPSVGERADRHRDLNRMADVELDYLYKQLVERGHAHQVVGIDDGSLKQLAISRVGIAGDDAIYGFVKLRPVNE